MTPDWLRKSPFQPAKNESKFPGRATFGGDWLRRAPVSPPSQAAYRPGRGRIQDSREQDTEVNVACGLALPLRGRELLGTTKSTVDERIGRIAAAATGRTQAAGIVEPTAPATRPIDSGCGIFRIGLWRG